MWEPGGECGEVTRKPPGCRRPSIPSLSPAAPTMALRGPALASSQRTRRSPAARSRERGVSAARMRGPSPGCSRHSDVRVYKEFCDFYARLWWPPPRPLLGLEFTALGFDLHLQRVSCQDWRWGAGCPQDKCRKKGGEKEAAAYTQEAALLTFLGAVMESHISISELCGEEFTWPESLLSQVHSPCFAIDVPLLFT